MTRFLHLWSPSAEGKLIATVDSSNNVTYLGFDHLATTKQTITGGTASTVATYYPHGEQGNGSINPEYQFTNQIRENNALDHFWMRTYAPNLGRWLTPDPANLAAVNMANPQSWNRYSYVSNNPVGLSDPMGLCPQREDCESGGEPRFTDVHRWTGECYIDAVPVDCGIASYQWAPP